MSLCQVRMQMKEVFPKFNEEFAVAAQRVPEQY